MSLLCLSQHLTLVSIPQDDVLGNESKKIRVLVQACVSLLLQLPSVFVGITPMCVSCVLLPCAMSCNAQVVEPAFMILDRLVGETFSLVQYDFVDLVYTLLEMAACRYFIVCIHVIFIVPFMHKCIAYLTPTNP